MPRFYLDMTNSIGFVHDEDGSEHPTLDLARHEAILSIRSILSDELEQSGTLDLRGFIEIKDESRRVLETIRFGSAITIKED